MKKLVEVLRQLQEDDIAHTKTAVFEFLRDNPNPGDDVVHKWAEAQGYDVHVVEAMAYELASNWAKFMSGGKSKGVDYDVAEAVMAPAMAVEAEHTDIDGAQRKIVYDHGVELGGDSQPRISRAIELYYAGLKELEAKVKKELEAE